ncbi:hypothetical protein NDU88_007478 [Pleurodeles waltl]|uniref:Secreted protein n=1 Tax=Pleurodeles waltl TaxID=8319 RepID=A0AAV7N261_PLEWA|nr:hypothetical protein NDU88_007478 [Pleurodeles waltl]
MLPVARAALLGSCSNKCACTLERARSVRGPRWSKNCNRFENEKEKKTKGERKQIHCPEQIGNVPGPCVHTHQVETAANAYTAADTGKTRWRPPKMLTLPSTQRRKQAPSSEQVGEAQQTHGGWRNDRRAE